MAYFNLTDETWLDLTVNIIPLGILLFMEVMFFVFNPWGWDDPLILFFMHFLTLFPFVVLAVVTYVGGFYVQRDEGESPEMD